jgi:hypothetical protein
VTDLAHTLEPELAAEVNTSSSAAAQLRAMQRQELKDKQRQSNRLQLEIDKLDKEKSEILAYYFENPTDYASEKSRRLIILNEELQTLESQWFKLQADLEALVDSLAGETHNVNK